MIKNELKPCPFCGGDAIVNFCGGSTGVWPIVRCQSCGANLPADKPRIGQTEKQVGIATEAWNKRQYEADMNEAIKDRDAAYQDAEDANWELGEIHDALSCIARFLEKRKGGEK